MSRESGMHAGGPIAARIGFPGPRTLSALGPWAAFVPASEFAARMTALATAVGWSMMLGPWAVRVSVEPRHGDAT